MCIELRQKKKKVWFLTLVWMMPLVYIFMKRNIWEFCFYSWKATINTTNMFNFAKVALRCNAPCMWIDRDSSPGCVRWWWWSGGGVGGGFICHSTKQAIDGAAAYEGWRQEEERWRGPQSKALRSFLPLMAISARRRRLGRRRKIDRTWRPLASLRRIHLTFRSCARAHLLPSLDGRCQIIVSSIGGK